MKQVFNAFKNQNAKNSTSQPAHQFTLHTKAIFYFSFLLSIFLFAGCTKQDMNASGNETQLMSNSVMSAEKEPLINYNGLQAQTLWELQQARAATAKYRNIQNAIKDGYSDIMVDVEGMGHHYMKSAIVDATFDIRQPEILVYNRDENGNQELVAVEYAVPLIYSRPEGFTGPDDLWNNNSGFPLWLLHAWVWAYNPDGVFNWTNPNVHLH